MKILAINGSPRKGGNTDILLGEFLRGAAKAGGQSEVIEVRSLRIVPCHECLFCYRDGVCIIDDDMKGIYDKLLASEAVVLASPIFFYGVTGWAKALVDRAQALWARKYILKDPIFGPDESRKAGFFLSVGGTKGERMFEGAILTAKYFFDALHARYDGELLFRKVDEKGEILKVPEALTRAYAAGEKLAGGNKLDLC